MARERVRRRRFLIDPIFQFRFVKKLTAMVLLVVTVATVSVLFVLSLLSRTVAQPDPFTSHDTVSMYALPEMSWIVGNLWPYFLFACLVVLLVALLFGLVESFRIAGPVYRMRRVLSDISRGRFDRETPPLRRRDELEWLYRGVLAVHRDWSSRVAAMQKICDRPGNAEDRLSEIRSLLGTMRIGGQG